jgi:hypothetical protein
VLWKDNETVITVNGKPKAVVMRIDGDPKEILDFIEKGFKWLLRSCGCFLWKMDLNTFVPVLSKDATNFEGSNSFSNRQSIIVGEVLSERWY